MAPYRLAYIPVGCIGITKDEALVEDDIWHLAGHQKWKAFLHADYQVEGGVPYTTGGNGFLGTKIQLALLNSKPLVYCARLFRARWALLDFKISSIDSAVGIVRVYLLPDDAERRAIDRSHYGLQKARQHLLRVLDYSSSAWHGGCIPEPSRLKLFDPSEDEGEESSLLQLFNEISSPQPDATAVAEPYIRDAMYDLLEGSVSGLTSELYPYQRRSAAMMLQKEVQPGQVLDPRLLHLQDANGSPWYLDPVTCAILRDPRYYDGVSGGVLAEEMGSGKTIICLALILATKNIPAKAPEFYWSTETPIRKRIGTLAEMAASTATRHAVPWKAYYEMYRTQLDYDFSRCVRLLKSNPGVYYLPGPEPRRCGRHGSNFVSTSRKLYLSGASLAVVPNNLLAQWKQEIKKHTEELKVIVLAKNDMIPSTEELLQFDLVLFSQARFEKIVRFSSITESPLASIHFKRCIVDEGHIIGNSKISTKSNLLIGLDALNFTSRWIVTGTPSHGLFGVEDSPSNGAHNGVKNEARQPNGTTLNETSTEMERKDLERIGSIAALYLKARPWANTSLETEDTLANWTTYLMLPRHNARSQGRWDCLQATLNSLIIRHRLHEVGDLLPPVEENIVMLDGSYQDRLSLNIFAMMIIFNSVQSQRTDMDYFFHSKQKKSLLQIVHNLKQSSFFGGSFFNTDEVKKSVETAEKFMEEKKVPINAEDEELLLQAIQFGHLVINNKLRTLSNQFHEMPVCVTGFPGGAGQHWSLDGEAEDPICTSASMLLALQKLLYSAAQNPEELNSLLNGGLIQQGIVERQKATEEAEASGGSNKKKKKKKGKTSEILAGNTKIGDGSPRKNKSHGINGAAPVKDVSHEFAEGLLAETKIVSTVSAKLSYLIDNILKHQDNEKIIVFYENENVAWYLASMLDVVSTDTTWVWSCVFWR
jgi:hypothetical protein